MWGHKRWRKYTIDRFSTYISLYLSEDVSVKKEKGLQKRFEEFVFHEGYYPISEAQLNNGRIDTLVYDKSDTFLFELKQIDFDTKKETPKSLNIKLKSAQIQSSIYRDHLRNLNNISDSVFIILFTKRKIHFKADIDRIVLNLFLSM